jgi:hypothetical protein
VAAIEFALIALVMIVLLLGLFVFWRAFQVQQTLNRAAGDGARNVLTLISRGLYMPCSSNAAIQAQARTKLTEAARTVIRNNLENSGLSKDRFTMRNPRWLNCASSTASFSFDAHYQLPPLLGENDVWVAEPTTLQINERIVVHFPSGT